MKKSIRKRIKRILYNFAYNSYCNSYRKIHNAEISDMCKTANLCLNPVKGEDEFLSKWKVLTPKVNVNSYRFYSQFIGNDPNILPDDLFHSIIDPLLNDKTSLPVYLNKNMYEVLIGKELFPICILRNMNGSYMNRDYQDIELTEELFNQLLICNERLRKQGRIIIKPAVETGRGKGVRLFCFQNGKWTSTDNKELSLSFLNKEYLADFIIQECIEPSEFIKQFNPTSYSTCRIYTYRSVKDGVLHFLGGYLRIGDVGSFKDNIGSGGYAIPIMQDGTLAHFASNGTRNKFTNVNGVDLSLHEYRIPNFDLVLDTAFKGARMIPLNRILSFDIILDTNNQPHIIEFNLKCQTITTMQTTYKTFLGEYTDEVIDYCKKRLSNNQMFDIPIILKNY